jgi:hypothetical protein
MSLWNWASNGPFAHLSDDTLVNMKQQWNGNDKGKPKDSEKTCPSALSTTNATWTDLGLGSEKLATNRLSYGSAWTQGMIDCIVLRLHNFFVAPLDVHHYCLT